MSQDEGYKHTDARFGLPPFGGSISQNVFYADSTLCSPTLQRGQGYPKPAKGGYPEPPFIMMVDRGDCSFVTQVSSGGERLWFRLCRAFVMALFLFLTHLPLRLTNLCVGSQRTEERCSSCFGGRYNVCVRRWYVLCENPQHR